MSKLDEGQYFINGKPLEIAEQIDWKAFNEAMEENMLQAALECVEKTKTPGLIHLTRCLRSPLSSR